MQPIVYKIRLDAGKPGSQASICVKQGDIKSRQLSIYLYNNSVPFKIPNGATVVLQAIKPDETMIFNDCDISGNIITHTMTEQMLTVAGTVSCELVVYGTNGEVLFSPGFDVYVEAGNSNRIEDPATSSSEFTGLTEAMRKATELTAKWSNPEVEVTVGETPSGKVEFGEDSVNFTLTVPNSGGGGGTPGGPGAVFTPHVSEDGTISWTNNGGLPNPEPQNIKGEPGSDFKIKGYYSSIDELNIGVPAPEPGDAYGIGEGYPYDIYVFDGVSFDWVNNGSIQGPPGEDGNAATIRIGTITTGEPGSEAQATNSGTENDAVIDFVIPRGDPGPGVPAGGTTGQFLRKASDEDYSAEWADVKPRGVARNLLANPYFVKPINQRGKSEYNVAGYTIDRWVNTYSRPVVTVNDGYITLENTDAANGYRWVQRLDPGTLKAGEKYTAAIKLHSGNTFFAAVQAPTTGDAYSDKLTAGLRLGVEKSEVYDTFFINLAALDKFDVDWVALYKGEYTADTLPEFEVPDPALELLKCQRYFFRLKSRGSSYIFLSAGLAQSTASVQIKYSLPTEMRINPTISRNEIGLFVITQRDPVNIDARKPLSDIEVATSNLKDFRMRFIGNSFEVDRVYNAWLTAEAYIDFSADL